MAKYKGKNQAIGEKGENIFRLYSQESLNLTPNKLEHDYGIDFSCQISSDLNSHQQLMSPEFLLVNVKSSAALTPFNTLSKADMEFTLKSAQPLVFILVDTNKNEVFHRFFDEELLNEFYERLLKNKNSFRLDPSKMNNNVGHFKEQLSIIKKRSYQNKLSILKARLGLQKLIGNITLRINQTEDGSIAIIEVNEVEDLFDKTHKLFPQVRETFLAHDLNNIKIPQVALKNMPEQLDDIADIVSLVAPLTYDIRLVQLKRKGKEIATCHFVIRGFGDEIAYYHPSGLSLTLSRRRKAIDNQYHHVVQVLIISNQADTIFEYPELVNFLAKTRVGDLIDGMPLVETWPELLLIGEILRYIPEIYNTLELESYVQLSALKKNETAFSYLFIKQLLLDKRDTLIHFILGTDDILSLKVHKRKIQCPFIFSLPEGQFIATIEFDSELFFDGDNEHIVGIKSTRNPVVKSCLPTVSIDIFEPILLLTEDKALTFFSDKNPVIINNPLNTGEFIAWETK
ncbi:MULTISPECIES: DUF4365 domain-containing protein [unclassified Paenibacillus]|uniref:DUF4365 domain-containing protein n=1 Tax=unclassified Paenibacillus TaxID=185978 RepID=UPI0024053D58|nr:MULTISPECIES: DUF4365 domain-containing protein [unclassified Paenibacillus]MDF9845506.1 hypothetical protein [Paenibacillus sp. PastF-2]MDF9852082.1 hypothetical protein [Paenibacillus sp. PastM-2]MDF9858672.1 hypothetical protein [Paenibacillus sp. PastF-1]MDH6483918.1 hypothetical protein [Paenibacillus sp. PastH-2]MDH6511298.1 hypothetical protein [Paenibacillus sp. PastM-3]